ncbi:YfiT family bacillithiol transferase [Fibrella forsythiae]|uniref:Metal-dependent hydrolase n=1 Tax=Fibrella forsythiae TaxID=2817061 RepID=A0ABS3JFF0_9BACT|nr:putative metal-dependent hydrolase [Fibrella forsythiae]MBO0948712.1 putative metal-dependent hydrolase [Fibrella forsythiae]
MQPDESRQFPIGRWSGQTDFTADEIRVRIQQLRDLPGQYRQLTESLSDDELARTYRPGSWTVRQLVHHVADTHQWHYFRIKHALTLPEIAPGMFSDVNNWAKQPDGHDLPVAASLAILEGLHERLAYLYEHLPEADLQRAYYHPFRQLNVSLAQAIDMVVWHAQHHLAHIRLALN